MRICLLISLLLITLGLNAQSSTNDLIYPVKRSVKSSVSQEGVFKSDKIDSAKYKFQYQNILFTTPRFHFDGRRSSFSISRCVNKFEIGIGLNPFGVCNYHDLTTDFAPTDEWISKADLWLLYLEIPVFYEFGSHLKLKFGKLYFGVTPQILIAGQSQFVTQLDNPIVVHEYDYSNDPESIGFETKWNVRLAVEYRIPIFNYFELGLGYQQNMRKIAPNYFLVNHSFFQGVDTKKVHLISGLGLSISLKIK